MRLTRRGLLRNLLLLVGVEPARRLGSLGSAAQAAASLPAALSASELNDLVAFAEVLVGGQPLPAPARAELVEQIEARTAREADYLTLYRTTARLLEQVSGGGFARLDFSDRTTLVERHRLASDVLPDETLGPTPDDARAVRTRARRDLIADYYGSPAGWRTVGYGTFPGTCGDLSRYTRAEP